MIAILDVDYRKAGAVAAAVLAKDWTDPSPAAEVVAHVPEVAEYAPGEFFRRELPCLLAVLRRLPAAPSVVVIDGYVWLGPERPGLGARLYEALGGTIPMVGVAKSNFRGVVGTAQQVFRAGSGRALWVTAIGIDAIVAAEAVRDMHGAFRVPTLFKRADQLCRSA